MTLDARAMINRLPPFPDNVIRLMAALRQDYITPEEMERKLIACPVIAGRVLSLANSSFYGFPRGIDTLREACVILGQQTLKNLVYTLAVMDRFQRNEAVSGDMDEPLPKRIWRYALYNASSVMTMGRYSGKNMPEAFTAALFENLGLIFLDYFEQERFGRAFHEADAEGISITHTVIRHFGCQIAELSYLALDQWQFPEAICDILKNMARGEESMGAALIRVSHLVSKSIGQELASGIWPDMPGQRDLQLCRKILEPLPEIINDTQKMFEQLSSELL